MSDAPVSRDVAGHRRPGEPGAGPVPATPLARYLADRDEPCPSCGYNLRGLTGERCPECNEEVAIRITLVEPRIGGLLLALSGPLAVAGTAALCLIIVFHVVYISGHGWPRGSDFFWAVVYPPIMLALSVGLALALASQGGRRWFRTRSQAGRIGIIALSWAYAVAATGAWLAGID